MSSLVAILTGIWKTLVSISSQIQRRLELRESRVLARHKQRSKRRTRKDYQKVVHAAYNWYSRLCSYLFSTTLPPNPGQHRHKADSLSYYLGLQSRHYRRYLSIRNSRIQSG